MSDPLVLLEPMSEILCVGDREMDEEDKRRLNHLTCGWGMRRVVVFAHFTMRHGTLCPPTGYAASLSADTPFVVDPFLNVNLCMGMSTFEVDVPWDSLEIPAGVHAEIVRLSRRYIADTSPSPPEWDASPVGGWVEALGDGGSVGLFVRTGEDRAEWSIRVVASLHRDTVGEFELSLLEAQDGKVTVGDAARMFERLEVLADFNRRRIAAAFAEFAGATFKGTRDPVACEPYVVVPVDAGWHYDEVLSYAAEDVKGDAFPSWYQNDNGFSVGYAVSALTESHELYGLKASMKKAATCVTPDTTTVWNVVRTDAADTVFFYNGCTPIGDGFIGLLGDPCKPFEMVRKQRSPTTLNAFANVARVDFSDPPAAAVTAATRKKVVWVGNGDNVNLEAKYHRIADCDAASLPKFVVPILTRIAKSAADGRTSRMVDEVQRLKSRFTTF